MLYVTQKGIKNKDIFSFHYNGLGPMRGCPGQYYPALYDQAVQKHAFRLSNVALVREFCSTGNDLLNPNCWRSFSKITKQLGFEEWSNRCDKMVLYLEGAKVSS